MLLTSSFLHAAEITPATYWQGLDPATGTCQTLRFTGEVLKGQEFRKPVGFGMIFRLAPNQDPTISGWTIELRSEADQNNDFLWVATPPYRFSHPRYLDTSYGYTARQAVAWSERDFNFVLDDADHDRLLEAVRKVLWPSGISEAELEEARRLVDEFPRGSGSLRILDARIGGEEETEGRGWIENLKFEVELCVPGSNRSVADIRRVDFVPALEQKFLREHPDYESVEEAAAICGDALIVSVRTQFADLDSHPGEEAVVEAGSCFAGTGGIDLPAVFAQQDTGALLELPVRRPDPATEDGRRLSANLRGKLALAVEDHKLVELDPIYSEGDANCCPSGGVRKFTYHWDGSAFVVSDVRDLPPEKN